MDIFTYLGKNRMTKRELANLTGIPEDNLYRYLNGSVFPSIKTAIIIERATKKQVTVMNFFDSCWKVYKEKHKIK